MPTTSWPRSMTLPRFPSLVQARGSRSKLLRRRSSAMRRPSWRQMPWRVSPSAWQSTWFAGSPIRTQPPMNSITARLVLLRFVWTRSISCENPSPLHLSASRCFSAQPRRATRMAQFSSEVAGTTRTSAPRTPRAVASRCAKSSVTLQSPPFTHTAPDGSCSRKVPPELPSRQASREASPQAGSRMQAEGRVSQASSSDGEGALSGGGARGKHAGHSPRLREKPCPQRPQVSVGTWTTVLRA
mmetsp:Transcript_24654/g.73334  ORF Transcript_24654/g.73334 Transcript_24654/m.73334 type:complete len:242 (+) Transcript_24654:556-1281(+)